MNLVYRKHKKLKPTCHVLTITQIRRLGKLLQLPSLANSMEIFMEPANLFLFNKTKLNVIHQYLLDHDLTKVKKPSIRAKQPEHAQLLIDLIYPGYPIAKAREQAGRQDRESRSAISKKGAIYFAYDQLPSTDAFERWDELIRLESPATPPETCQEDETWTYRYTINAKKLEQNLDRNGKHSIRLCLYVWMSPRHSLFPHFTSLKFNGVETWCEKDKETVDNRFKYVDITDKLDWESIKSGESDMVDLEFSLDETMIASTVKYVTICNVWEKSSTELVCQLYTQTASFCISSAMTANRDTGQIQRKALDLLDQCPPKDRWCLDKTETLLLDCGRAFHRNLDPRCHRQNDDSDDELMMGNEYISLMDPILLTKILHPARGNFCRHVSCFDAKCFLKCYRLEQLWKCPICHIHIRGIQDLYIDHRLKQAIVSYPDQSRLIYLQDGTYQSEHEYQQACDEPPLPSQRPLSPLVLKQQSLSPTPLSPLPQSDSDSDINPLDISDVPDEKDQDKPASKRQKIDRQHQDITLLLD